MPSITQLQYILAVERFRHFGKAAADSHVSQPSLSLQIQKVEEEIGFPIFDRSHKPIVPSPKGLRFIEQARHVVRQHEILLHMAGQDSEQVFGDFALGIIPTVIPYLLPKFISSFACEYPDVRLTIEERTTADCLAGLRDGKLDAAILATPLHEKGIRERVLYYESFSIYANPSHKILARKTIRGNNLDAEDIWLLEDGHCFRNQILSFCSLDQTERSIGNVRFEAGSLEMLRRLIQNSWGYTLFPQMMLECLTPKELKNQVREFSGQVPYREISLVFSRDQWKKDILDALRACIDQAIPKSFSRTPPKKSQVIDVDY